MSFASQTGQWTLLAPIFPVVVDAAVKSALVLIAVGVAVGCMRKCSAAARHLVWFLAVASLPLLPVLSLALPGWHILPRWFNVPKPPTLEQRAAPIAEATSPPAPAPSPVNAVAPAEARTEPQEFQPTPLSSGERTAITPATPPKVASPSSPHRPSNLLPFVLPLWLAGAALAFLPTALGLFSLWRLERNSRRETASSWLELLRQLVDRLKFKRAVALLKTDRRRMPMTWGIFRPKLLLPDESQQWTEDRRHVVLLHELAHAKRWDYLTNLVTQFVCALYWFNPLVWFAARQMIAERERACDDIVLRHGARPADYAEQILQIAAGLRSERLAGFGGIAMARPSKLEARLRAILDGKRNRAALTRAIVAASGVLLVAVVIPVAMIKAQPASTPLPAVGAITARKGNLEELRKFLRSPPPLEYVLYYITNGPTSLFRPSHPSTSQPAVVTERDWPIDIFEGSWCNGNFWTRRLGPGSTSPHGPLWGSFLGQSGDIYWNVVGSTVFKQTVREREPQSPGTVKYASPVGEDHFLRILTLEIPVAKPGTFQFDGNRFIVDREVGPKAHGELLVTNGWVTGIRLDELGFDTYWIFEFTYDRNRDQLPWFFPSEITQKAYHKTGEFKGEGHHAVFLKLQIADRELPASRFVPDGVVVPVDAMNLLAGLAPTNRAYYFLVGADGKLISTNSQVSFPGQGGGAPFESVGDSKVGFTNARPFTVKGRVTDPQGNGIAGVTIIAHCGMGTLFPTGETNTDATGHYTLHFREGMKGFDESSGQWRVAVQAATISPRKAGWFETNLYRGGDLLMADRLPAPGENVGWKLDPAKVVLPNRPYELNFVMQPAARIVGQLSDELERPMARTKIWIDGELPPSSSVLAETETDDEGRFRFEDVPTGYFWIFHIASAAGMTTRFDSPGELALYLRVRESRGRKVLGPVAPPGETMNADTQSRTSAAPSIEISLGLRSVTGIEFNQRRQLKYPLEFRIKNLGRTNLSGREIVQMMMSKAAVHARSAEGVEQQDAFRQFWDGPTPPDLSPGDIYVDSAYGDLLSFFPSATNSVYEVWWTLGDLKSNRLRFNVAKEQITLITDPMSGNPPAPQTNPSGGSSTEATNISYAAGFAPEKSEVTIGETIYLEFNLTNTGSRTLLLAVGGDQWGLAGPYRIRAFDARGTAAPDPYGDGMFISGGPIGATAIEPGQVFTDRLLLTTFVRFEQPGDYTVITSRKLFFYDEPVPVSHRSNGAISADGGLHWVNVIDRFPDVRSIHGSNHQITNRFKLTVQPVDKERLLARTRDLVAKLSRIGADDLWANPDPPRPLDLKVEWNTTASAWLFGKNNDDLRWAVRELSDIGDRRIIPELMQHLSDPNMKVRFACVKVLCALGEPLRAEWIVPIIKSGRWTVHDDPETFVKEHGGAEAAGILIDCLDTSNPSVTDLWNFRLLNIIRQIGNPELSFSMDHDVIELRGPQAGSNPGLHLTWHHDEKREGTPREIQDNAATLQKLREWLKTHPFMLAEAGASRTAAPIQQRSLILTGARGDSDESPEPGSLPGQTNDRSHPFIVTGRVTDERGNGLGGATITAHCGQGTLLPTGVTNTDANGYYTLRFREGMSVRDESTGVWRAGVQAATITPRKAGFFEANLARGGDLLIADKLPAPDVGANSKVDPARVVLPNQPYDLDFVMRPAASVSGRISIEEGRSAKIWIDGDQLPPSCSVLAETNADPAGHFHFEDIPTGYTWCLNVTRELRTEIRFDRPGSYTNLLIDGMEISGRRTLEKLNFDGESFGAAMPVDDELRNRMSTFREKNGHPDVRSFWNMIATFENAWVPRAQLLEMTRSFTRKFPGSQYVARAQEMTDLLTKMIAEEKVHLRLTAEELSQMPVEKRVAELIFQLRDQNGRQWRQPGMCDIFANPGKTTNTPAHQLVRIGYPAVPQLIAALDDRTLTRSVGFWRNFTFSHNVLSVGDCAVQILEKIAGRTFFERRSTSSYLSVDGDVAEVRKAAEAWYAELQRAGVSANANPAGRESSAKAPSRSVRDRIEQIIRSAPMTTNFALEIFQPGARSSFAVRSNVVQLAYYNEGGLDSNSVFGMVYHLPAQNRFYIGWDAFRSEPRHYYGPFKGNPFEVLGVRSGNAWEQNAHRPDPKRVEPDNPLGLDDETLVRLFNLGKKLQRIAWELALPPRNSNIVFHSVEELYANNINRDELGGDPFGSGKLRLEQKEGKTRIYSVGPDGEWNRGQLIKPGDAELKGDLGVEIEIGRIDIHWLAEGAMLDYLQGKHTARYLAKKGTHHPVQFPLPEWTDQKLKFGPMTDGLRAAVELITTNGEFVVGRPIEVRFHIRNEADHDIQIASEGWRQGDEALVDDEEGKNRQTGQISYTGISPVVREILKPGQTATFKSASLELFRRGLELFPGADATNSLNAKYPVGYIAKVAPGKCTIRFRLRFPGWTAQLMDWQGELETGPVIIDVKGTPLPIHQTPVENNRTTS